MPFGLTNASGTFQRLMDVLIKKLNYKQCLCYFDNPIIHTPDFDMHILALEDFFEKIKVANLKLKPRKCRIASSSILDIKFQKKESNLTQIKFPLRFP